jgi:hypothetical protein
VLLGLFSNIVACLEDRIGSIQKELDLMHLVANISIPIALVLFKLNRNIIG